MTVPNLLIDTWEIDCFEIRGAKTYVKQWMELTFSDDGNCDCLQFHKGKPYKDKVTRYIKYEGDKMVLIENNRLTFTVIALTNITLTLINPEKNLIYYCKRKQQKHVL